MSARGGADSAASRAGVPFRKAEGDLERARTRYEEAGALRETVVATDPEEDFAEVSLDVLRRHAVLQIGIEAP